MRGEFIAVWAETWSTIWLPLAEHGTAPRDLFCELYRELAGSLKTPPSIEELADVIDDLGRSVDAFKAIDASDFAGERAVVTFVEGVHNVLEDLSGDVLANYYFNLLETFANKFNLRYDLRRPCTFCPTLAGVFASLVRDLRLATSQDTHLDSLMKDFEDAIRDLRTDASDSRIKTCIQKQVNLLEAIGRFCPGVTKTTLGAICDQIRTWPHDKIREAMKNLYGFASDYPGIRHGGTPTNALRAIEMRDLVSMTILLAGFTPYLMDRLDAEAVYRGT